MSGHSHARTIKHQKELTDKKRGQIFSKLARLISVAVKEGGPNPEINSKLRLAIEMARSTNMPRGNIDRAIKRGAGEIAAEKLEEVLFEAYGPGGIAIIIEGITDNKNRALGEIKQALNQNGGKLVSEGAVKWMFERKIKEPGSLEWVPKQEIEVDEKTKETCQKLFEALDELDSVQEIYSNLKL
ncbi:MAG: YebC/PmpR family DNA-binding transcriptional regulator [Candidatus Nealsonbacteria bacterium CG_4_9_14_3_um_filter_37_13]|uniref:Probable transcriptional regulatory protein CO145_01495 n=1 Tax=Candidatus Nealsonbacteria bacterium CG_4_9_14_3_um_filter_37_13 TaxID=1974695 RepID=A0A2M7Z577_9BACT|nr:MAG: YebC/PmpR family DNA-binding transcriptional regulator [Candidatus Nealsonbacteria bacterium CG_4_9_14_3_um_filter_37_13]